MNYIYFLKYFSNIQVVMDMQYTSTVFLLELFTLLYYSEQIQQPLCLPWMFTRVDNTIYNSYNIV